MEKTFVVMPFVKQSAAKEIQLGVVKKKFLNEDFVAKLYSFPDQKPQWASLPQQTSREDYFERIKLFLDDIRAGKLQKAILSRVLMIEKPADFDPFGIFKRLCQSYPNTFVHLLYHPEAGMWTGATPELLLEKQNGNYFTMALAGTQPCINSEKYHWRKKEMEEHTMVGEHIEEVFKNHSCNMIEKNGPKTIESGKVAHLQTDYVFKEKNKIDLHKILNELHPTPAVGGLPVDKGVECILQHEGYDRRYYCGYVGETDFANMARLFINLRCMQIGENHIAVYCGGGITAASDPTEEWNETIQKSLTMVEKISPVKDRAEQ